MTIYEIDEKLQRYLESAIDPETGEIANENALEEYMNCIEEREKKVESIFLLYKDVSAEAEAVKKEKMNLQKREKTLLNKAVSLKRFGEKVLEGEKFKTPKVSITYRKSEGVVIGEHAVVPPKYLKCAEPKPDLAGLKKALKEGKKIDGIKLETRQNIQIN